MNYVVFLYFSTTKALTLELHTILSTGSVDRKNQGNY